jgi:hypothetical protein
MNVLIRAKANVLADVRITAQNNALESAGVNARGNAWPYVQIHAQSRVKASARDRATKHAKILAKSSVRD